MLHAARAPSRDGLVCAPRGGSGGGGHLLRQALLVGEVAMVTGLLFGTGLLLPSYAHLQRLEPGFEPAGRLAVQYSLDDSRYADADRVNRLFAETLSQIRRVPGVTSTAAALSLPYERPLNMGIRRIEEDDEVYRTANVVYVTPGFFETLGIPLLDGRGFDERDRADASTVAVVNAALAARDFPDGPAIGRRLKVSFSREREAEVVGVVGNVQQVAGWGPSTQPVWETPTLYVPVAQATSGFLRTVHV